MAPRGRPSTPRLSREAIEEAASALLADDGDLSMRGLARRLGVDAMALYHWFPDRDAVLAAVAERRYGALSVEGCDDPRERVHALARALLAITLGSPALVRALARSPDAVARVADTWQVRFAEAGQGLVPADRVALGADVLADLVHGFALAGRVDAEALRREVDIVLIGLSR